MQGFRLLYQIPRNSHKAVLYQAFLQNSNRNLNLHRLHKTCSPSPAVNKSHLISNVRNQERTNKLLLSTTLKLSTQNQIQSNEYILFRTNHLKNIKLRNIRKEFLRCCQINNISRYYSTDEHSSDSSDSSSKTPGNYKDFECPFPLCKIPEDVPALQRLKESCTPVEPPRCGGPRKEERTPRADDCYEVKEKTLPKLIPTCCPPTPQTYQQMQPLQRLKKRPVQEPLNICPAVKKSDCPPRADANLKVLEKQLPILSISNCPQVKICMNDSKPLKVLAKMKLTEIKRFCPESEICHPPDRADFNLKISEQELTKIKFDSIPSSKCNPPPNIKIPRLKGMEGADSPRPCNIPQPEEIVIRCDDVSPMCPPKQLSTMILKEKNNCISTRDYNKQKYNDQIDD